MWRVVLIFAVVSGCVSSVRPAPTEPLGRRPPREPAPSGAPVDVRFVEIRMAADEESTITDPATVSSVPALGKRRITLDLRDVEVRSVLRFIAEEANANIVVDDAVSGRITMRLDDVPIDEAFLAILQSQELGFSYRGEIMLVGQSN